jgi:hypothetical protein
MREPQRRYPSDLDQLRKDGIFPQHRSRYCCFRRCEEGGQVNPAMNKLSSVFWSCGSLLFRVIRLGLTTCAITGSHITDQFWSQIRRSWSMRTLFLSAITVVSPEVRLFLQMSLALLGVSGAALFGYSAKIRNERRRHIGRYHRERHGQPSEAVVADSLKGA